MTSAVASSSHVAILRFSALGDIAMCIPVIVSLAAQYPDTTFTFVSRPYVAELFSSLPENVHFFATDLKVRHRGLRGLHRLAKELQALGVTHVADLHHVLRTIVLRHLLQIGGARCAHIDKGRSEKKLLVKKATMRALPSSFARYAKVFQTLGFPVTLNFTRLTLPTDDKVQHLIGEKGWRDKWLGVAPFAAHKGKIYPLPLMTKALKKIVELHPSTRLFIFGAPKEMESVKKEWKESFPRIFFVCDHLHGFSQELQLMEQLNAMISMDSGNMHLASLVAVPVISIWGQTHPRAGFMGWKQSVENAIQVDLSCRPCSIFGNKPCVYKDYHCMTQISPNRIAKKVDELLKMKKV